MSATDDHVFEALFCAVHAADNAIQAAAGLWASMTPAEQDRWLEDAESRWPRADVMLQSVLPAAEQIVADERAAADRTDGLS